MAREEDAVSATIIEMNAWRLRADAKEYVRRFVEYGFECAALWSMDHVREADSARFSSYVREEMRKCGFSG
ncbi:MAG: hypothetical protein HONDAALG_01603 [Gammaproteobacteria bacterium]|nr:hypothetical protein [Gammaproteobacteria bacterium]